MIEGGLPQMVLWELPEEATAVESSIPQPGGRPVDMINRGFPSYTGEGVSSSPYWSTKATSPADTCLVFNINRDCRAQFS
ncbi:hypothetical protein F442_08166 [Phytophthora nicotianae P10297]|uniref:Uncharacterized protein n=1 Tax=Phytophthora nicotianae P10297 TaxID=1317064 RepID=W2ZDS3_PHYNI|nr:hypothetical protein F442_08166 [Phytophthora nicotianae P10297]